MKKIFMNALSKSLPKDVMGKDQPKFTTELKDSSSLDMDEQLSKVRKDFYALLSATLKNQDPLDPTPMHEIAQTTTSIQMAQQSQITNVLLQKLVNSSKEGPGDKVNAYIGKQVFYDGSKKEFSGDVVQYKFNLNYKAPKNSDPLMIKLRIQITDEKGKTVYKTTTSGNYPPGLCEYIWHGIDNDGKKLEKGGKYKINIVATKDTELNDGKFREEAVDVSTDLSGMVSDVIIDNKNIKLLVNGSQISESEITRVSDKKENALESMELGHLIGKIATVNNDKLFVKGGHADIYFENNLLNHGNGQIEIYNSHDQRVSILRLSKEDIKTGKNSLNIKALGAKNLYELDLYYQDKLKNPIPILKDDVYYYKVSIENLDKNKRLEEQSLELSGKIDLVNFDKKSVVISDNEFSVKDIKSVSNDNTMNSIYSSFDRFIGKKVAFEVDSLNYQGESCYVQFPLENEDINYMNFYVYDSLDNLVYQKTYDKNQIVTSENKELLKPSNLDEESRKIAVEYLNANQIQDVSMYIREKLMLGEFEFQASNEMIYDDYVKYKSEALGFNLIKWDGENLNGQICKKGMYRYKIEVNKNTKSGIETSEVKNISSGTVTEIALDGLNHELIIDNKIPINVLKIKNIFL
jgi:flagellar hook assembly protein FlgD